MAISATTFNKQLINFTQIFDKISLHKLMAHVTCMYGVYKHFLFYLPIHPVNLPFIVQTILLVGFNCESLKCLFGTFP